MNEKWFGWFALEVGLSGGGNLFLFSSTGQTNMRSPYLYMANQARTGL